MTQSWKLRRLPIWIYPIIAVLLAVAWQWTTVTANFGGNWTALYCTGALQPHPEIVVSERVYVFAASTGYDGQYYHYIAHDPFLRSGMKAYIDDARLRYRRILLPLLAYVLALGRSQWVDLAYVLLAWLTIGFGVYWSCSVAEGFKLAPAWGLSFLLVPASLVTMDRLVIDGALAALTAAFLSYRRSPKKLFVVLVCACLVRETGFLLVLGYCGFLLLEWEWRRSAVFLSSMVPALSWYAYVATRTGPSPAAFALAPFSALPAAFVSWPYPAATPFLPAVHAADYLAIWGLIGAFALAILWVLRGHRNPAQLAAFLFAVVGLGLETRSLQNVYHFGRIYSPLLLCLAATAAQFRKSSLLIPMGLMLPRIAIQLTPQILGIVRWVR